NRAASAGGPLVDTLKTVDGYGYVTSTVDRDKVLAAQTPQIFDIRLYRAAAYSAKEKKEKVTDDNMLMERIGQAVKMVNVGRENIKLTTPFDFLVAEAVLAERNREGKNGNGNKN
ncbi:MAG: 2-C-methyl-D-erythritol 4-phosphate cytidylyltransferase, partial [Clostridia bacterium]|nr:2-C-methyl-D-erythritol 4-phosphate cytidylyltransferase [Clostridia bacterium]